MRTSGNFGCLMSGKYRTLADLTRTRRPRQLKARIKVPEHLVDEAILERADINSVTFHLLFTELRELGGVTVMQRDIHESLARLLQTGRLERLNTHQYSKPISQGTP